MKKLLAVTAIAMSFSSQAALIDINAGLPRAAFVQTDMFSTNITSLGFNITNATSVYYQSAANALLNKTNVDVGDIFSDVGVTAINLVDGQSNFCERVGDPDEGVFCSNEFKLQASYNFFGLVQPLGGDLVGAILGGFIDIQVSKNITARTATPFETVASLAVTGSQSSGVGTTSAGISIFGVVDYSGLDVTDPLIKNFFSFSSPVTVNGVNSTNWVDLWTAGVAATPVQSLNSVLISTLSGPSNSVLPSISSLQYGQSTGDFSFTGSPLQNSIFANLAGFGVTPLNDVKVTARTGESLSGSVVVSAVPEPVSIALFGAGLLGMGLVSRRRREKSVN
ncbi:PEP-CTERM sorting domain-containing protein [Alishewanella tabrizica]|uniref:Ice-binding protein C-terminal domain-containing protein n=1 Tax=Alishewanella tabrizica TaxID=671278 RepID=A0ABQ2WLN0_9ALTE|nr:PEP-CTERM sorting domain-containing protein [Alishewanella tabrizica]GGW62822.1 hypothetical protein GCM10008111_18480 [Alishewanella tabrizica]